MVVRRSPDVVDDEVDGRAVLVDADGRELITLNPTGTLVWRSIDGVRDRDEIARLVHEQVEDQVTLEQVERDVRRFVDELVAEGLAVRD